jgi:hypothetical protein
LQIESKSIINYQKRIYFDIFLSIKNKMRRLPQFLLYDDALSKNFKCNADSLFEIVLVAVECFSVGFPQHNP